jgi:hypothetical protein
MNDEEKWKSGRMLKEKKMGLTIDQIKIILLSQEKTC